MHNCGHGARFLPSVGSLSLSGALSAVSIPFAAFRDGGSFLTAALSLGPNRVTLGQLLPQEQTRLRSILKSQMCQFLP